MAICSHACSTSRDLTCLDPQVLVHRGPHRVILLLLLLLLLLLHALVFTACLRIIFLFLLCWPVRYCSGCSSCQPRPVPRQEPCCCCRGCFFHWPTPNVH